MSQLTTFVAPIPNFALIRLMGWVNRAVMLKGVVGLRDLPVFNRLAGLRGISNVRRIDFPVADQERLKRATTAGNACFVTPNHPEFFTDWMIDKEIASRFFPKAAFWATNAIVNGFGRTIQKFWLANNLIAQIPGNSAPAREHSIQYASAGHVVLLHPEGQVGWHRNHMAKLMPGAAEMALEAARRCGESGLDREVWLAPIVWKLAFIADVTPALERECAYVERKLGVSPGGGDLPGRVYSLYRTLLERDEAALGLVSADCDSFARRHARRVDTLVAVLAKATGAAPAKGPETVLRAARKKLRVVNDRNALLQERADMLAKALRIGDFAWDRATITQEEMAEHLKRLRADHCFGGWRDTMNRFVPQPAGPRIARIRVAEPIHVQGVVGSAMELTDEMRTRMQDTLDRIEEHEDQHPRFANPFRS